MSLRLRGAASAGEQDPRCRPQGASGRPRRMFPKRLEAFVVRKECSSCPAPSPFKALRFPASHMTPFPIYSSLQLYFTFLGFSLARSNIGSLYAVLGRNISLQNPAEESSPPATLPRRGVHLQSSCRHLHGLFRYSPWFVPAQAGPGGHLRLGLSYCHFPLEWGKKSGGLMVF